MANKGGLVNELSPWVGRWGVYWRIQQLGVTALLAEQLAIKYPRTWEIRFIQQTHKLSEV